MVRCYWNCYCFFTSRIKHETKWNKLYGFRMSSIVLLGVLCSMGETQSGLLEWIKRKRNECKSSAEYDRWKQTITKIHVKKWPRTVWLACAMQYICVCNTTCANLFRRKYISHSVSLDYSEYAILYVLLGEAPYCLTNRNPCGALFRSFYFLLCRRNSIQARITTTTTSEKKKIAAYLYITIYTSYTSIPRWQAACS